MKKAVPKWHKETADHHYYQATEDQDEGVEQQVDGDDNEYQDASYIVGIRWSYAHVYTVARMLWLLLYFQSGSVHAETKIK